MGLSLLGHKSKYFNPWRATYYNLQQTTISTFAAFSNKAYSPLFFPELGKMLQNLSSVVVVIGTLRVYSETEFCNVDSKWIMVQTMMKKGLSSEQITVRFRPLVKSA